MEYRRLGRSGLKVSVVSLGSWLTFGRAVDDEQTAACVQMALEGGINLIDTADVYARGEAEKSLGRVLSEHQRSDIVLATKVYFPMSDGVNDRGLSRKHIKESCEASLQRLQTDYIDLYQCHRFDPDTPVDELVRSMDDLVRQGKIHYWGVSCWEPHQIYEACEIAMAMHAVLPISNQPPYNMLEREIEEAVIPASRKRGLSQIVFSPLAQGLLTGKYRGGVIPEGSRLANDELNRFMKRRLTEENLSRIDRLHDIAEELGISLATLALAWCLNNTNVASVIMGATRIEQVEENIRAASVKLDAETVARIEAVIPIPEE